MSIVLLAAFMMAFRFSIIRSVLATIFCIIAVFFYSMYIGDYMSDDRGVGLGLMLNFIISIAGIILPICNIVVKKVFSTNKQ